MPKTWHRTESVPNGEASDDQASGFQNRSHGFHPCYGHRRQWRRPEVGPLTSAIDFTGRLLSFGWGAVLILTLDTGPILIAEVALARGVPKSPTNEVRSAL
jgi:hypothetical protein